MMGVIDQMLKPSAVGVDEINPNRAKITLEPLEMETEKHRPGMTVRERAERCR